MPFANGLPLIGVSTMDDNDAAGVHAPRFSINQSYCKAVEAAGGVPIMIPHQEDADALRSIYEILDGLLVPGGTIVGGHAILLTGWSPRFTRLSKAPEVYRVKNSWGADWGVNGSGYLLASTLIELLVDRRGEAAVPVGRRLR